MVQDNLSSNKIKENKYKILRMSLLLGNGEDKEETIVSLAPGKAVILKF